MQGTCSQRKEKVKKESDVKSLLNLPMKLHTLAQATQPAEPDHGAVDWHWEQQYSLQVTHPP
jgi:hypothetical protein